MEDRIVQSVVNKFQHRSEVGMKKYGTNLERNDLSIQEWLTHAQEEAMDLCLYLERLKQDISIINASYTIGIRDGEEGRLFIFER